VEAILNELAAKLTGFSQHFKKLFSELLTKLDAAGFSLQGQEGISPFYQQIIYLLEGATAENAYAIFSFIGSYLADDPNLPKPNDKNDKTVLAAFSLLDNCQFSFEPLLKVNLERKAEAKEAEAKEAEAKEAEAKEAEAKEAEAKEAEAKEADDNDQHADATEFMTSTTSTPYYRMTKAGKSTPLPACNTNSIGKRTNQNHSPLQRFQKELYQSGIHVTSMGDVFRLKPRLAILKPIRTARGHTNIVSLADGIHYEFLHRYFFILQTLKENGPGKFFEILRSKYVGFDVAYLKKFKPLLEKLSSREIEVNYPRLLNAFKQNNICQEVMECKEIATAFWAIDPKNVDTIISENELFLLVLIQRSPDTFRNYWAAEKKPSRLQALAQNLIQSNFGLEAKELPPFLAKSLADNRDAIKAKLWVAMNEMPEYFEVGFVLNFAQQNYGKKETGDYLRKLFNLHCKTPESQIAWLESLDSATARLVISQFKQYGLHLNYMSLSQSVSLQNIDEVKTTVQETNSLRAVGMALMNLFAIYLKDTNAGELDVSKIHPNVLVALGNYYLNTPLDGKGLDIPKTIYEGIAPAIKPIDYFLGTHDLKDSSQVLQDYKKAGIIIKIIGDEPGRWEIIRQGVSNDQAQSIEENNQRVIIKRAVKNFLERLLRPRTEAGNIYSLFYKLLYPVYILGSALSITTQCNHPEIFQKFKFVIENMLKDPSCWQSTMAKTDERETVSLLMNLLNNVAYTLFPQFKNKSNTLQQELFELKQIHININTAIKNIFAETGLRCYVDIIEPAQYVLKVQCKQGLLKLQRALTKFGFSPGINLASELGIVSGSENFIYIMDPHQFKSIPANAPVAASAGNYHNPADSKRGQTNLFQAHNEPVQKVEKKSEVDASNTKVRLDNSASLLNEFFRDKQISFKVSKSKSGNHILGAEVKREDSANSIISMLKENGIDAIFDKEIPRVRIVNPIADELKILQMIEKTHVSQLGKTASPVS